MMNESLAAAHVSDDTGVLFRHVSRDLGARIAEGGPETVAVRRLPGLLDSESLRYNPFARELVLPDLYRNHLSRPTTDSDKIRTYFESEVHVHEWTHHHLYRREEHYYHEAELASFSVALTALVEGIDDNVEKLREVAQGCNAILIRGQLLHEGLAIESQLSYLENALDPMTVDEELDWVNKSRAVSTFLGTDHDPQEYLELQRRDSPDDPLLRSPAHSFGHWLLKEVKGKWTINIDEYAFRIATEANESIGTLSPDTVLLVAAFTDSNSLVACSDSADELELLLAEIANSLNDIELRADHVDVIEPVGDWKIVDRATIYAFTKRRLLENAIRGRHHYQIPLLSTSYPGREEGETLWEILRNMFCYVNESGERLLFLPQEIVDWAGGTELMDLAIDVWWIRELLFSPLYQAYNSASRYRPLALLESIENRKLLQGITRFDENAAVSIAEDTFLNNSLAEIDPNLERTVPERLTVLGRAVSDGDRTTVGEYFS